MWFTSSNARAIQSKVEQREKGLALASASVASDHNIYLGLTGEGRFGDHETRTHPPFFLAPEIVAGIEQGQWTASQVVQAYIARAALSAKLTNSVTEGECSSASKWTQIVKFVVPCQYYSSRPGSRPNNLTMNLRLRKNCEDHCMVSPLASRINVCESLLFRGLTRLKAVQTPWRVLTLV